MYSVYRDYTSDGVLGLNGKQWLNDINDDTREFESVDDAIRFLEENDTDIYEDEFMHIVATDDDEDVCLVEHNPHTLIDSEAKEIVRERNNA